jgi:hypothetical protein
LLLQSVKPPLIIAAIVPESVTVAFACRKVAAEVCDGSAAAGAIDPELTLLHDAMHTDKTGTRVFVNVRLMDRSLLPGREAFPPNLQTKI